MRFLFPDVLDSPLLTPPVTPPMLSGYHSVKALLLFLR